MTPRAIILGLGAVAMVGLACEKQPEPKEESGDREVEIAQIEPAAEPVEETPVEPEPPSVDFRTWPGSDEYETFDLMWLGGDEEISLHEEPDRQAPVVASASWLDGEQFDWTRTLIRVETPRGFRADRDFEIVGTPYDIEYGQLEADDQRYRLQEDDPLYLYRHGDNGTCYLGIESEVVYTQCPEGEMRLDQSASQQPEDASEGRWTAVDEKWWIETSRNGESGWFDVEGAPVEVHPRNIEGYDEFDGTGPGEYRE